MIETKKFLLVALAIPILALGATVARHQFLRESGERITLPISGYDPRDLLSGHYLVYQIDYGVPDLCAGVSDTAPVYVCLETKIASREKPMTCKKLIRGICGAGARFNAGIERYYIPAEAAARLESLVRSKTASIEVAVDDDGAAQVVELLIDGVPWHKQ